VTTAQKCYTEYIRLWIGVATNVSVAALAFAIGAFSIGQNAAAIIAFLGFVIVLGAAHLLAWDLGTST